MPHNQVPFELCLHEIPSPKSVAVRLLELFRQHEVDLREVTRVISVDPALSAKIMAYCNSPRMGRTTQIDSLNRAITTLGTRTARTITLTFSLVDLKSAEQPDFDLKSFWSQSLATAIATQALFAASGLNKRQGYLVGLMLNIGQIAMHKNFGDEYLEITRLEHIERRAIVNAERDAFGIDRFRAAGLLLNAWAFPDAISTTIREFGDLESSNRRHAVLDLSSQLATMLVNHEEGFDSQELRQRLETGLNTSSESLDKLVDSAVAQWCEYRALLDGTRLPNQSLRSIENEARQAISHFSLANLQEQEFIRDENTALKKMSQIDSLTQLGNRRALDERLQAEFSRSIRHGIPISLAIIDIDHFKSFNDNYGHAVGDEALRHVAKVLRDSVRLFDSLFRFGGEEFVFLLPGCRENDAHLIGERILNAISESNFYHHGEYLPLTVSIGIASNTQEGIMTAEELFKTADRNLYAAKAKGRNCCVARNSTESAVSYA